MALINCWVQLCMQKSKCAPRKCTEANIIHDNHHPNQNSQGIHSANVLMRNLIDPDDVRFSNGEASFYRDAGVRIIVEDPYGIQAARSIKPEVHPQNTIGLLGIFIDLEKVLLYILF